MPASRISTASEAGSCERVRSQWPCGNRHPLESSRIDILNVSKTAAVRVQHVGGVDQVWSPAGLRDTGEDGYSRPSCEYAGEMPASEDSPSYRRAGKQSGHRIHPIGREGVTSPVDRLR